MKVLQLDAMVRHSTLTAPMPPHVQEGPHRILLIDDVGELDTAHIEALQQALHQVLGVSVHVLSHQSHAVGIQAFPVDDYGPWPADLSVHREELYD